MASISVVFLAYLTHLVFVQSECPSFYKRSSKVHTFCKPPMTSCKTLASGVNDTQIKEILRLHNEFRSKIANGQETVVQLPPAADMLQMEWDPELAAIAQAHAEQCEFKHDCSECRAAQNFFAVGQNLYSRRYSHRARFGMDWSGAITSWYNEVEYCSFNDIMAFGQNGGMAVIGHFTQVIWSKSWNVGCGFVSYKNAAGYTEELYTCNYGPSGNYLKEKVYEDGAACSKCPGNTECKVQQTEYPGLCQVMKGKHPDYDSGEDRKLFCDFSEEHPCDVSTASGMKQWEVVSTLEGSYGRIVLKGGEKNVFNSTFRIEALPQCFSFRYRNGPNEAAQKANNKATLILHLTKRNKDYEVDLPESDQRFTKFQFGLGFNTDMTFSMLFSVPEGAADQYLEVTDISVVEGDCMRERYPMEHHFY